MPTVTVKKTISLARATALALEHLDGSEHDHMGDAPAIPVHPLLLLDLASVTALIAQTLGVRRSDVEWGRREFTDQPGQFFIRVRLHRTLRKKPDAKWFEQGGDTLYDALVATEAGVQNATTSVHRGQITKAQENALWRKHPEETK